jgi:hypothetical protein
MKLKTMNVKDWMRLGGILVVLLGVTNQGGRRLGTGERQGRWAVPERHLVHQRAGLMAGYPSQSWR